MSVLTGLTHSDSEIITQCTNYEKKNLKYELLSLSIQFIVVFAAFGGGAWTLSDNVFFSILIGMIFGVAVWVYESAGIEFLRVADEKAKSKYWKALVFRCSISVLIAFSVSKTIELILHDPIIKQIVADYEEDANKDFKEKAATEVNEFKQLIDLKISSLDAELPKLDDEYAILIKKIAEIEEAAIVSENKRFSSNVMEIKQRDGWVEQDGRIIESGEGNHYDAAKAIKDLSESRLTQQQEKLVTENNKIILIQKRLKEISNSKEELLSGFIKKKKSIERKYRYKNISYSGSFLLNWWALDQIYKDKELGKSAVMTSRLIKGLSMLLELMPLLTFIFFSTPLASEYKRRMSLNHEKIMAEIDVGFQAIKHKKC